MRTVVSPRRRGLRIAALAGVTAASVAIGVTPGHAAAPGGSVGGPTFTTYNPPASVTGANTADEPSIGVDWKTGAAMYQSLENTFKVTFNDNTKPATATWTDVTDPWTTTQSTLDPILFTDATTGRTLVSQLSLQGACSWSSYTDDDGANWQKNEGCGLPSGIDHQTVGGGPYAVVPSQVTDNAPYSHAVYYCSQAVADAYCALSVDGGLTYNQGVPIYTAAQCGGLHGHLKVAPNGTVVVPNQGCTSTPDASEFLGVANQGVTVSTTNGEAWTVHTVPDSVSTLRSDPSVGFDANSTMNFGYESGIYDANQDQVAGRAMVTTSPDSGTTWTPSVDVGAPLGIQNVTFPEVAAGDPGHAAMAFLGSTTAGNPENQTFQGFWYLYVAITSDGWKTFNVQNLTPGDPVERGCIYLAGSGDCPSPQKRNLYDFMDMTSDAHGRLLIGYSDGCINTCVTDQAEPCSNAACSTGPTASIDHFASIARESCGSLIANDPLNCDVQIPTTPEAPWAPALVVVSALGVAGVWWRRSCRQRGMLTASA